MKPLMNYILSVLAYLTAVLILGGAAGIIMFGLVKAIILTAERWFS